MSEPTPTVDLAAGMKKRSGIKKAVIADIKDQRSVFADATLSVLVGQVGKVARAMTYDNGDATALYESLIRVTAAALVMAKRLHAKRVIQAVHLEMNQAVARHMWAMTPLNPQMPDGQKLVVLVEEVGEAADAPEDAGELIQVATMAAAWAQSCRATRTQDWATT